jgi:hypothetical protein
MKAMSRSLILFVLLFALLGCGGGGDGGGEPVNFTVTTDFPAYSRNSTTDLAGSRSVWVYLSTPSDGATLWSGLIPRPSDAGGSVTRRMHIDGVSVVNVTVQGMSDDSGFGNQTGRKTFNSQPLGTTLTVTTLE